MKNFLSACLRFFIFLKKELVAFHKKTIPNSLLGLQRFMSFILYKSFLSSKLLFAEYVIFLKTTLHFTPTMCDTNISWNFIENYVWWINHKYCSIIDEKSWKWNIYPLKFNIFCIEMNTVYKEYSPLFILAPFACIVSWQI